MRNIISGILLLGMALSIPALSQVFPGGSSPVIINPNGTPGGACNTLAGDVSGTCNANTVDKVKNTAPGTGVVTAFGTNVGTAGAFVVNGGALGTPASGTLTNATGLPSSAVLGTTTNNLGGAGVIGELAQAQINGESISVTMTNASPTVVTMAANTFASRCSAQTGVKCVLPIYFTGLAGTSGVSNTTTYFVDPASISGNTFQIATSIANALSGTDVNTTGTDSGTGKAAAYITNSSAAQSIVALSLTAGDWDCQMVNEVLGVASTAPTVISGSVGQTVNNTAGLGRQVISATFATGIASNAVVTGMLQQLLAAQTSVYGSLFVTWTGGATNPTATGELHCRRQR